MNFVDNVKVYQNSSVGSAAATAATYIDTKGYERAHIFVNAAPHALATTSAAWGSISVRHGAVTNPSTVIAAASFATAASTNASNILPTTYAVGGGTIQINLDLKTKERYLGIYTVKGASYGTCAGESITVLLSKPKKSADSSTEKATINYGSKTDIPIINVVNA